MQGLIKKLSEISMNASYSDESTREESKEMEIDSSNAWYDSAFLKEWTQFIALIYKDELTIWMKFILILLMTILHISL